MSSKICKACNTEKDYENFNIRLDSKDGLRNVCKDCISKKIKIGKLIDETNNTYGKWKVISRANNKKDGSAQWNCICECGTEKVIPANSLRENSTKSCGCRLKALGIDKRSKENMIKKIYRSYKHGAISRGHSFELSIDEFIKIINQNCYYCDDKPQDKKYFYNKNGVDKDYFIISNGIDRINNDDGYTINNSVPCCKTCNSMKSNQNIEDFIEKIIKISKNINKKENNNET